MKDTRCDYCDFPYFTFKVNTNSFTTTDIIACIDNEDDALLDINVFHEGANHSMICDGSFSIPIKYCPHCGRKLGVAR